MDARGIAVQKHISKFLRDNGVYVLRDKRGLVIFANDKNGRARDIELRKFSTYVADKMEPR